MKYVVAGLLAMTSMCNAFASASSYTGKVLTLRTAISTGAPNYVRISVQIAGATSCTNSGWYSAEVPDTNTAVKTWIATLLAAQARDANVTIAGTGICDPHGIETIYFIDALP